MFQKSSGGTAMFQKLLGAVVVGLAVAMPAASANAVPINLVTNGDFEQATCSGQCLNGTAGIVVGWTVSGFNPLNIYQANSEAHSGFFGVLLGSEGGDSLLSQSIATTVGNIFEISFWFNPEVAPPGSKNDFSVSFGGKSLLSLTDIGPGLMGLNCTAST
jgi:hypothetical protein